MVPRTRHGDGGGVVKEEEVEATLQDGYEVDARPASQPCPVHTLMEIAEARIRFAEEALEEALAESRQLF